jgi:uncharacterized protein
MRLYLYLIISGVLLSSACTTKPISDYTQPLSIGDQILTVAIANTPQTQAQGLSGRASMAEHQGMVFDFRNHPLKRPGFWMQGMQFDLDIIWIKKNPETNSGYRVSAVTPQVPHPRTETNDLPLYYPPSDIDLVLEVTAGWTERNKITVGDEVKIDFESGISN